MFLSVYADRIHTCTLICTFSQLLNSKCLRKSLLIPMLFIFTELCTLSKCQASVKQVSKQAPQVWHLNIKYINVQDVNKRGPSCFLIPEQVSETQKTFKIHDVLKIHMNK
jgi:hypothetical protein